MTILGSFKPGAKTTLDECFTWCDESRSLEAEMLNIPSYQACPLRSSKRGKASPDWKVDHKKLFEANNLTWPLQQNDSHRSSSYSADFVNG
eukprot:255325-Pyramimonas_sp.AAC.1